METGRLGWVQGTAVGPVAEDSRPVTQCGQMDRWPQGTYTAARDVR